MHFFINQLANSLFRKQSLEDCSLEELRIFVTQNPFYAAGQLMLAAKLKETDKPELSEQLQKTSLFINNPLWLSYLLNKERKNDDFPFKENHLYKIPYEDFNNDELVVENPLGRYPEEKIFFNKEPPARKMTEALENEKQDFLFEPYHTVDYFASQGIKPVLEEKPNDRFGQQLKSFTEWLKTLKNTNSKEITNPVDNNAEENIITLADHSLEDRNVITEAMAEVWIKQGHPEKAQAVYTKLSLLNPSKSSYFAGLIENLKKQ